MSASDVASVGVSGMAVYVPPYRVNLEEWCQWTAQPWPKIKSVIGHSFRMRGQQQSVYTMAAAAVLRLIEQNDIDPTRIGLLGLGTESSRDNSAGAVIVKGMVDDALRARGMAPLSRRCQVPEFKHACLGGVYALKDALRYLAVDGQGSEAIVVSADVALYARGSSGEPTQGAGAVAMWLTDKPRLFAVDLQHAGSASAYRAVDFRKPFLDPQHCEFPVFNGRYSTVCYLDETRHALEAMFERRGGDRRAFFHDIGAVFMHRPYHRMPHSAWALAYLFALAESPRHHAELRGYCEAAGVDFRMFLEETRRVPDLWRGVLAGDVEGRSAYPLATQLEKHFRNEPVYDAIVTKPMSYGAELMMDCGNLYTAALPAWLAAGFEDAAGRDVDWADKALVAVGYGSGDAAEALPLRVVPGWQHAARRIRFKEALNTTSADLSREAYEALHDGDEDACMPALELKNDFVIDRVGDGSAAGVDDRGIEFYRFLM